MKLSISVESTGNVILVDVPGSLSLEDFKAYLQAETDIDPKNQVLKHDGKSLQAKEKTLDDLNIKEDDLISIAITGGSGGGPGPSSSGWSEHDAQIEGLRQRFISDPTLNSQLQQNSPEVHRVLNNPAEFKNLLVDQIQRGGFGGFGGPGRNYDELQRLQQNPDDPESQARILELIRQEQIDENMKLAYEITPESFASINMLYINIKVNGHKVQAFVDSGAQTTIISPHLAEKVGISRLIDRRFQGEARGVGSQKIEGKIHSVPIRIGDSDIDIAASFMVIDTQVDLLFGLDLLRRHKCLIDLDKNVLVVGGNIETKFLHESEIENDTFGVKGSAGHTLGGSGPSGLGGNIFSDGNPVVPANSTPVNNSPAGTAGAAAAKRQKTDEPNSQTGGSNFKEADIDQLIKLGFNRQEAIVALEQTGGNVEFAASLLFQ